ncbi:hypothetical protein BDA99DRAFT_510766 [Phascolomyces articulosus]|uniref:Uncharacterized protein n=1 Tax=Phascolomyces articulosus TaxID=60185 RepID=A0AAD5K9E5_9FUNG|nr:hypothetical protein BDA99DRAFT_510766 [Phascolomyces articulosus]
MSSKCIQEPVGFSSDGDEQQHQEYRLQLTSFFSFQSPPHSPPHHEQQQQIIEPPSIKRQHISSDDGDDIQQEEQSNPTTSYNMIPTATATIDQLPSGEANLQIPPETSSVEDTEGGSSSPYGYNYYPPLPNGYDYTVSGDGEEYRYFHTIMIPIDRCNSPSQNPMTTIPGDQNEDIDEEEKTDKMQRKQCEKNKKQTQGCVEAINHNHSYGQRNSPNNSI